MQITSSNWQQKWQELQVKVSDTIENALQLHTPPISSLCLSDDGNKLLGLNSRYEEARRAWYDSTFNDDKQETEKKRLEMVKIADQIRELKKTGQFNNGSGLLIFKMLVLQILEYYGMEWSEFQMNECAQELYNNYSWLQLSELKLFVTYVKNGVYSTHDFRKLAPHMLLGWLDGFANQSLKIREQMFISKANDDRYNERWGSYDEQKGKEITEDSLRGQMEQIKSTLKHGEQ